MISAVTVWRYSLPLSSPIVTKYGELPSRQSLLIQWHYTQQGLRFSEWSEVCPLPGFSKETFEEAETQLIMLFKSGVQNHLNSPTLFEYWREVSTKFFPSVKFGIEMGLIKLFYPLLNHNNRLPIAGLINDDELDTKHEEALTVFKIKLGRHDLETDIHRVNAILNKYNSDTRYRLDANQSWSLEQSEYFFSQIPVERIEFIEEPLKPPFDYSRWQNSIPVSFALDEQTQHPDFTVRAIDGLSTIVVKPMLIGLNRTLELIDQAKNQDIHSVISSSYESSLTLNFLYQLAVIYTPSKPPGLDTFRSHQQDLIEPLALPVKKHLVPLMSQLDFTKVAHFEY